jgi:hypothetical protein
MPGPKKVYTDHFNKCPATAEQLLQMQTITAVTGKAPATLQREAWDFYCASETIAALLRQAHDEAIDRQQREDAEPINWKP